MVDAEGLVALQAELDCGGVERRAVLVRGAIRPAEGLPLQTLAMLGYGGAAVIALFVNPIAGSCLVAIGLLGHAAWDAHHHRKQRVVSRSMAEFCLVLDTALAVTIIVLTATA